MKIIATIYLVKILHYFYAKNVLDNGIILTGFNNIFC